MFYIFVVMVIAYIAIRVWSYGIFSSYFDAKNNILKRRTRDAKRK